MQTRLTLALIVLLGWIGSHRTKADVIAKSVDEFSGVQGQNGWIYGYRDVSANGASENYDPDRDFIPFAGGLGRGDWNGTAQQWTGTGWKTSGGSEITETHSRPSRRIWIIRRWQASELIETGPVSLTWSLAKEEGTCGNGVTGALYINGQVADKTSISFDRVSAVTRTFYAILCPNDRVDLVLRSLGTDGAVDLLCDSSLMTLAVSTSINPSPRQPDGRNFISTLKSSSFSVKAPVLSASGEQVRLNWRAQSSATYGVEASSDLINWTRIKTGLAGSPCQSVMTEVISRPTPGQRFYRVVEEFKTLEGLWASSYVGTWGLLRIKLEGDIAVATKVIGSAAVPAGKISWTASVTTGVGEIVRADPGYVNDYWTPAELEIATSDHLILTVSGSARISFDRVD